MDDVINRQMSIDAIRKIDGMATLPDGDTVIRKSAVEYVLLKLSSAQPERLTDDDFETIRIHLNAYKEKLCNQLRWGEADEYQRIIDRFMAFASAQPEPHWIPCKERMPEKGQKCLVCDKGTIAIDTFIGNGKPYDWRWYTRDYEAWMPLPEEYKEAEE